MEFLRLYNQPATILFPLVSPSGSNYMHNVGFETGDAKITIDGSALSNVTNLPTFVAGSTGVYKWVSSSSEILGSSILVQLSDMSSPKIWADQSLIITTFGHANSNLKGEFGITNDVYVADINYTKDTSNNRDEYTVVWFKNGVFNTGVDPTYLKVLIRDTGQININTAMTNVSGVYTYNSSSGERLNSNQGIAFVSGVLDGSVRQFVRVIGRDA